MQLIALNIGLQAGIVSPALFTVLVIVALVTTTMTAPLLAWLDRRDSARRTEEFDRLDLCGVGGAELRRGGGEGVHSHAR